MVMDEITMDVVNGWVMMEVVMEKVRIKMVVIMSQRQTSASDKRNRNSNCSFQWCGAQPPEPLNNRRRRWEIEHHRDSKAEIIPSVDHSVEMETLYASFREPERRDHFLPTNTPLLCCITPSKEAKVEVAFHWVTRCCRFGASPAGSEQ
ncbi:unnamed protein product [Brassica napus]|uniref:(rape) hypothetical protein n=1 Tax=Brassica napus TaxID=3708 RepID=A0A816VT13_BRANA|nr:unnamed protein product [Brassica napus]